LQSHFAQMEVALHNALLMEILLRRFDIGMALYLVSRVRFSRLILSQQNLLNQPIIHTGCLLAYE